ncbi:MAG: hypothetical protein ACRDT4_23010 [Micromonosporaceae bacterium]
MTSRANRSCGIADRNQSAVTSRLSPAALRSVADRTVSPSSRSAAAAQPTSKRTPSRRRCAIHGSSQTSLVEPFSTRSTDAPGSLPRPSALHSVTWPTSPIECALASADFIAARLRIMPSPSIRWYSYDIWSART